MKLIFERTRKYTMKFLPSKTTTTVLLTISIFLSVWGYCFEYAYFARLGLKVGDYLSFKYYLATSAFSLIPFLIILFIFTNIKRFFSKDIHKDPMEIAAVLLKTDTFPLHVTVARVGAAISVVFALCVFIPPILGWDIEIWFTYLYVVLLVLQTFFGAVATSPKHARYAVVLVFSASVGICFAAGGFGYAGTKRALADGALRDDFIVRVERKSEGGFKVQVKQLSFPLPIPLEFLETATKKLHST